MRHGRDAGSEPRLVTGGLVLVHDAFSRQLVDDRLGATKCARCRFAIPGLDSRHDSLDVGANRGSVTDVAQAMRLCLAGAFTGLGAVSQRCSSFHRRLSGGVICRAACGMSNRFGRGTHALTLGTTGHTHRPAYEALRLWLTRTGHRFRVVFRAFERSPLRQAPGPGTGRLPRGVSLTASELQRPPTKKAY